MPITNDDLQSFYKFALGVIESEPHSSSLHELADRWDTQRERDSVNDAIRKGHEEIAAGGGVPVDKFVAEVKAKYQ